MWNWHNTRCPSRAHTATLQHDKDCWLWCLSYSIILSVPNLDGLQANLLLVILSCAPPAALSGPILQGHCSHLSWLNWDSLHCPEGSLGKKLLLCLVYSALLQCCIMGWCCVGAGSIQGSHATGRGDLTAPVGSDSHQRVGQQHLLRPSVVAPASPEPLLPAHMGKLLYGKQQGQGTDWAWALPLCPSPCFLYCPTDLHCCMPTLWKTAKKKILLKFYVFNNSSTLNVAPAPELFYPYLFPWD